MIPRPYQQEANNALHVHICEKSTNPLVVIPTGGGKSALIAWIIQKWKNDAPQFRAIILAHRKELIEQNAQEFQSMCPGLQIGIFSAALKRRDYDADILFASIDSVYKRSGEFAPFDVAMVDEAHRIPIKGEGKYRTFLQGCRRNNPKLVIIGWTATPYRMGIGSICHRDHLLHEICYEASITTLIRDGYLCRLRSKVSIHQPDLTNVKKTAGEYTTSALAKQTNIGKVVDAAVDEAVRIMDAEKRRHAVFFCVNVEHCEMVSVSLRKHRIVAPAITNKTKAHKRERVANDFKAGKYRAICNVNVYTEGFNATIVDCIVLLRPTLSAGLFSQMVGRGLRQHPRKDICLVLDFAGCIEEHGPIDMLGNDEVRMAVCNACRESFSRATGVCPACGWNIPIQEIERLEAVDAVKRMHASRISQQSILSDMPEVFGVTEVYVSRHRKTGTNDSLLVQYRCGMKYYKEWICLDHSGFVGVNAQKWWRERFGSPIARRPNALMTVNDALSNMLTSQIIADYTKTVTVKKDGKYNRIVGYNEKLQTK